MEILISVPVFLQPLVELLRVLWSNFQQGWLLTCNALVSGQAVVRTILAMPYSNVLLPVVGILLVFWPILLSLIMALISVYAWFLWLFTSIVLGVLQLVYVTYQFGMISLDIGGLSILKTYTIVCNQFLHMLGDKYRRRKSRRLLWRQRLDEAGSYENFLKIRIDPKDPHQLSSSQSSSLKNSSKVTRELEVDSALPPAQAVRRAHSFSGGSSLVTLTPCNNNNNTNNEEYQKTSPASIPRNRSFSGDLAAQQREQQLLLEIDHDPAIVEELGHKTADLLVTTTTRLEEARVMAQRNIRDEEAASSLKYLLASVIKRNHLKLEDIVIENARSIAESGQYGLSNQSRQLIRAYYQEVEKGMDWIADAPVIQPSLNDETSFSLDKTTDIGDRIRLVRKMKQNLGRTALMLSGGGAQAMYHSGVIRALIESKLYNDIQVISGTSGGSIIAAMCAMMTAEELFADVCVPTISTDFMLTGEMKAKNIRWFPPMLEMAHYWMKHKLLVDSEYFQRTCDFYYKDTTFEEAFLKTGKHVCITVSASRASSNTEQRLLLNHISTPHVTIASAVRASCALPGVMAPAKLVAKNSHGILEPFEVDGVEWIDGSVQADLPFQRISTLFGVTSYIVSQTNFHVVPFLNKEYHPSQKSLYWCLFQTIEWDIRSRALKLSRLGLFPRFFGQDISKIFKQKYHGNLTIVPRFTTMQTFGLKALSNPTVEDMKGYLKYSQIATWPYLNTIRDIIRLEKSLDDCLARLEARLRVMQPDTDWSTNDDLESIASSTLHPNGSNRVRIVGKPPLGLSMRDRDADRLRQRMSDLERDNEVLRDELEKLRRQVIDHTDHKTEPESQTTTSHSPLSDRSEGAIWNIVRSSG